MDRRRAASITACSCHLSPPFHAPKHSNFLHPANENQACFLPIALDLPTGRALRLFPLFCCAILSCENCDSSSVALPLAGLPRWLSDACLSSVPLLFQEEEIE